MKNRTEDADELAAARLSWMDQETWSRIKADSEALFDRLVDQTIEARGDQT